MAIFQGSENKNSKSVFDGVNTKSVLRYTMMPEILPRIRALGLHFGHFAYLLALVFSSARLIPSTHPALNAANIGRYGVRQVIAIAANNLTWSKNNIDQIAIFGAIVLGLIMIVIQALLIAFAALVGFNPAEAQTLPATSFFESPDPANDPVILYLAQVFGDLGGFWGHDFTDADGNVFGGPFHNAIYQMLSLYSMAMMVIAVIIVVYYIMTVVGEAAKSGTPFGQRFNTLWAPIRLVVALGLLVPLGSGLNSAQYLTLWMAKMGSGFGTQVWQQLSPSLIGTSDKYIIGDYENDWVAEAAVNIFFMEACRHAENAYNKSQGTNEFPVSPMIINDSETSFSVVYEKQRDFEFLGDGQNYVKCGHVSITLNDEQSQGSGGTQASLDFSEMFDISKAIISRLTGVSSVATNARDEPFISQLALEAVGNGAPGVTDIQGNISDILKEVVEYARGVRDNVFAESVQDALKNKNIADLNNGLTELKEKSQNSWIYSGVWYLELSRLIALGNEAQLSTIPNTIIGDVNMNTEAVIDNTRRGGKGGAVTKQVFMSGVSSTTDTIVNNAWRTYQIDKKNIIIPEKPVPVECETIGEEGADSWLNYPCLVAAIIMPQDLTRLRTEPDLDPMATLVDAGIAIFYKSFTAMAAGLGASALGGIAKYFGPFGSFIGGVLNAVGSVAIFIGGIGLAAGFILYFFLPLMPFIYFFFAVAAWVMEIFEAVIAMPLWALAHLHIDGDGMPGQAAMNGYYLLFAILIRPPLIVIGLVAGALLFHAGVFLLQSLFHDVLFIKGSGNTNGLEMLLYTIMFAYLCYNLGLVSFKLVDKIPDGILRWIGSGASVFSNGSDVDLGGNQSMVTGAAALIGSQAIGSISANAQNLGSGVGKGIKGMTPSGRAEKELAGQKSAVEGAEIRAKYEEINSPKAEFKSLRTPDKPKGPPEDPR